MIAIPVTEFLMRYEVTNPEIQRVLCDYPVLCYLLGKVTSQPQGEDSRPDGVSRPVYFLTEGSGLFGLNYRTDAEQWQGIFNHIMGSARQVYYLAQRLTQLTSEQKVRFADFGFDANSFDCLDPLLLRDFMFISHAGRRQVDEREWHNLHDVAHPEGDTGQVTMSLLRSYNAHPILLDLMRVETSGYLIHEAERYGFFRKAEDNILTYCDWTFGQHPMTLVERFASLRTRSRGNDRALVLWEASGHKFQRALEVVLGLDSIQRMMQLRMYEWEREIRKAYWILVELLSVDSEITT